MEFGQTLAEYAQGVALEKVPKRDVEVAKLAILDQIGVALAGVGEDPGVKVQNMIDRCSANEATVFARFCGGLRVPQVPRVTRALRPARIVLAT